MKTAFPNSAKRVLSLVLAFAMLVGTLFVANVGVSIKADAATGNILYWDANGTSTAPKDSNNDGIYEITSVAELNYVCRGADGGVSGNKKYKVADGIDAFVLQPQSVIPDLNAFLALDAEGVKDYFADTTPVNWLKNGANGFNGSFDGNGVKIYGLYADAVKSRTENAALFPTLDGGNIGDNGDGYKTDSSRGFEITIYYDNDGITIENFSLSNSYTAADRRVGTVFADINSSTWASNTTASDTTHPNYHKGVDGVVNLDGISVSDCYAMGTEWRYTSSTTLTDKEYTNRGVANKGVFFGNSASGDIIKVNNCILYNNIGVNENKDGSIATLGMYGNSLSSQTRGSVTINSTFDNMIVCNTAVAKSTDLKTKVGTYTNVKTFYSIESLRGGAAMAFAPELPWGNGWYAVEGEYPTPINPGEGNYLDFSAKPSHVYSRGTGTETDPYIIRTVDQLYKMVHEYNVGFNHRVLTNKKNGTKWDFYDPYYYKVADGIDELYINDVTTMTDVKELAESGGGNKWTLTAPETTGGITTTAANYGFFGNFDGNGVTIYGLISTDGTGFVYRLKGNSAIKNVNFEAAYSKGSNRAAVVTTNLGTWNIIDDDHHTIANVSVRNSYVEKTGDVKLNGSSFTLDGGNFKMETKNYSESYNERFGQYDKTYIVEPSETHSGTVTSSTDTNNDDGTVKTVETITYDHYTEKRTTVYKSSEKTEANIKSQSSSYTFNIYDTATNAKVYQINGAGAAGLVSTTDTTGLLTITNCMFDGMTSQLVNSGTTVVADNRAGILSQNSDANNIYVSDCVSVGGYSVLPDEVVTADGVRIHYNRFGSSDTYKWGSTFENLYTDKAVPEVNTLGGIDHTNSYGALAHMKRVEATNTYEKIDMPTLSWGMSWQLEKLDGNTIPMPIVGDANSIKNYSNVLATQENGKGAVTNSGVDGFYGKYGWQTLFAGSGTAEDPYLITNALELARAIGSGGESMDYPLYYKLTCDIDLGGATWLSQASIGTNYAYVPFSGVLDGAGFSVLNFAATDETAAGLIPVLDGGTVKNLHIRNAYAGSPEKSGLIAGEVKANSVIENCSVEGSEAVAKTTAHITGDNYTLTNSYYIANGEQQLLNATDTEEDKLYPAENAVWYKGSDEMLRHVSFAKAHAITDVDGDGITDSGYIPTDIVALRNHLLERDGYENIYGDVSRNGTVNISDLAILRRYMAGDYNTLRDGFWRNLEIGKFEIYYDENDNYDFARKMQLYLEAIVPSIEVQKYVPGTDNNSQVVAGTVQGTPDANGDTYINIKTDTSLTYDQYKVEFDSEKLILTISGGSFTAVEQAVLDFIANADPTTTTTLYTTNGVKSILDLKAKESLTSNGVISEQSYKQAVTVNGTTYYYAWGDEFEGDNTTVNSADWQVRNYKYEESANNGTGKDNVKGTDSESANNGAYHNMTSPTIDAVKDLWEVNNGKLTIWRGVNEDATDISELYSSEQTIFNNKTYTWGYKSVDFSDDLDENNRSSFGIKVDDSDVFVDPGLIQTANSMLFKQGYAEMRASLPSDGHAFPAWWFYNGTSDTTVNNYERLLYGKVYKLNNEENNPNANTRWNGVSTKSEPSANALTSLPTYKYMTPKAYLEFDIVEFMEGTNNSEKISNQHSSIKGEKLTYPQITIHKNYNLYATGKGTDASIYIADWANNSIISQSYSDFNHSAGSDAVFNHKYEHADFQYPQNTSGSSSGDGKIASGAYKITGGITKYWTYGFSWWVNEAAGTYELTIYVDFDEDGIMQSDERVVVVNQDDGHYVTDATDKVRAGGTKEEAKVWNQYAYMLIDNAFYSSNYWQGQRYVNNKYATRYNTIWADLLAQGSGDKATFDIEYVRVYQEDNKRDIVNSDTEAFNTGNRFGY